MEPDDGIGADEDADLLVSPTAFERVARYDAAIKVLRWAAALAFLIWLLNLILTASALWDATGSVDSTGPVFSPAGVFGSTSPTTAERVRDVIIGATQSGGFYLLTAVVAYGFSVLLASGPRPTLDDE
jgi:hypothetical protein